MSTRTPKEAWEEHNRSFQYDPPDEDPEYWDEEHYTELVDRVIAEGAMVRWECQKCTTPFGSLRKARSHVRSNHMEYLLNKARSRMEEN